VLFVDFDEDVFSEEDMLVRDVLVAEVRSADAVEGPGDVVDEFGDVVLEVEEDSLVDEVVLWVDLFEVIHVAYVAPLVVEVVKVPELVASVDDGVTEGTIKEVDELVDEGGVEEGGSLEEVGGIEGVEDVGTKFRY